VVLLAPRLGAEKVVVPLDCHHPIFSSLIWVDRFQHSMLPSLVEGYDFGLLE